MLLAEAETNQQAKDRETERKSNEESSESRSKKTGSSVSEHKAAHSESKTSRQLKHKHNVMSGIRADPSPMTEQSR